MTADETGEQGGPSPTREELLASLQPRYRTITQKDFDAVLTFERESQERAGTFTGFRISTNGPDPWVSGAVKNGALPGDTIPYRDMRVL
jgi:hypothetical protein